MGVPAFFRWLLEKYPRVIEYVVEEQIQYYPDGKRKFGDASQENPNGIEFDNLYLDMNGIIHPCCHPEDSSQPNDEDEMINNVFHYIDHIFSMIRPRKILFMAIDGVAPRAKMNQQRSRRFKAAQEMTENNLQRGALLEYYAAKGLPPPPQKPPSWDSNVITPGTPFMDKLAKELRWYVHKRLHSDPGWKNIKVIFTDANVPGEGEHKIAAFIRRCRTVPGWDPNTRHCLYGLDADLFMLGLATHEAQFYILREEVKFGKNKPCERCGEKGHWVDECPNPVKKKRSSGPKPFVLAKLPILREYLLEELSTTVRWGKWDFERSLDDFIFLCFFVGNDFLPHLPSLDIREGAIDNLIALYKKSLNEMNGYLTDGKGKVNLPRVDLLLRRLGKVEDNVFSSRKESENFFKKYNAKRDEKRKEAKKKRIESSKKMTLASCFVKAVNPDLKGPEEVEENKSSEKTVDVKKCDEDIKAVFGEVPGLEIDEEFLSMTFDEQLKAASRAAKDISGKAAAHDDMTVINTEEDVRFGSPGWKNRYYRAKFKVEYDAKKPPAIIKTLFQEYVRGLCWVMLYYYQGCASWGWFFPFHYAPMASDLADLGDYRIKFDLGTPFKPYGQLMGVLPAASAHALPPAYRDMMSSAKSPIIDFYPTDFRLDLNGKKFQWQAVTLLPFCDQKRLLDAIEPLWDTLTDDQKRMNSFGVTQVYVNAHHPMAPTMIAVNVEGKDQSITEQKKNKRKINVQESQGMGGYLIAYADVNMPGDDVASFTGKNPTTENCQVISAVYELPDFKPHVTCLLPGVVAHEPVLTSKDFDLMRNGKRFGKPRQKRMRRHDSHNDYNRTWGHQRGYEDGNYRATKRNRREDEYQPHRTDSHRTQRANSFRTESYPQQQYGRGGGGRGGGGGGSSLFITGERRDLGAEGNFTPWRGAYPAQNNGWRSSNYSRNPRYSSPAVQNRQWGNNRQQGAYENDQNFNRGYRGGGWSNRNYRDSNQRKRKRG